MPRKAYEDEINENSTQEHLELCLIEATRTSDTNVQKAAARARAEISRRERQERRDLFDAESRERVKGQEFQDSQTSKQLEIAKQQAKTAQRAEDQASVQLDIAKQQAKAASRAMVAAWASAIAAFGLLILAVIQSLKS